MRIFRCNRCAAGFAILSEPSEPSGKGKSARSAAVRCPVCAGTTEQLDPVAAIGSKLAHEAWEFWKKLPPGE